MRRTYEKSDYLYRDVLEALSFNPDRSFYDFWEEWEDPEWLIYLARAGGATREQIVMSMCAVVRLCLPEGHDRIKAHDRIAKKALRVVES